MKKITSLFAVLAMLATFVVMPVSAATGYAGGDGLTAETAYEIATAEQLAYAATKINDGTDNTKYFKLTADIDYNSQEWVPMGTSASSFKGNFDGQRHVVKNIKITTARQYIGFFGYINGGTVKNLGLEGMDSNYNNTSQPDMVGGFAARVDNATITNCYLKNSIVKYAKGQVSNCVGVFAAVVSNGSMVENCYVYNIETLSHVNNVNAAFANQRLGSGGATFKNCYAAEIKLPFDRHIYSFGSDSLGNVNVINCWSTRQAVTSGSYYEADYAFGNYVADKDTLASKFEGVEGWAVSAKVNDGYPCLVSELPEQLYADGDGSKDNPYQIANATHLANASAKINDGTDNTAYFVLTADIDYNDQEWVPMGNGTNTFQGTFDGQGHVVTNLKITAYCAYVGFFGCIGTGGVVKNLGIDKMNLYLSTGDTNPETVGGFASYVQGATITNCYLKNSVVRAAGKQASNGIGVFAGLVRDSSVIKNCYAYNIQTLANLNNVNAGFAHQRIGGGSTFENCYAAAIDAMWGRPAYSFGSDNQSSVTVTNCWSTLVALTGGNYKANYAFGDYVADKDTLASKFEGVEGWAVSPAVNGGYPCFATEVPFKVTSVDANGTVRIARKAGVTTPATVYVATYDSYGRMVDVKASAVNADDFTFTPEGLTTSTTLKVFVWDGNNTPLTNVR